MRAHYSRSGARDAEQAQAVGQHDAGGVVEPEPGAVQVGDLLVALGTHAALVVPLVGPAGEVLEVARDPVRLAQPGRLRDHAREVAEDREQRRLGVVGQQRRVEAVRACAARPPAPAGATLQVRAWAYCT